MTPSTNQVGSESKDYETDAARMIDTKPDRVILPIHPQTEQHARTWLGAANRLDASVEIKKHFATQIERLQE